MKQFGKILGVTILAIFVLIPFHTASCDQSDQFELDFGGWFTSLNSQVKSGKGAGTIDVHNNLGLDERKTVFPISVRINLGGPYNIFADYYSYSISGDRILERDVSYNLVDFSANTATSSKYSQDAFRTGIKYMLTSKTDSNYFIKAGLLYYKMKLDISSSTVSTSDSMSVPFPFFGYEINNHVAPNFTLGALLEGMLFSFQDNSTTYLNFDVFLQYEVVEHVSIRTSYRYENLDAEREEDNFNNEAKGFYLGLNARF